MKKCANTVPVDLTELLNTLPPMIARKDIDRYLGGIISKGYLANLDSKGEGPPKIKIGKNVGYLRRPLVEWLASRSSMDAGGDA
jgi:hypothetical protein